MTLEIKPGWTRYREKWIFEASVIIAVSPPDEMSGYTVTVEDGPIHLDEDDLCRRTPEVGDMLMRTPQEGLATIYRVIPRGEFESENENA